MTDLRKTTGLGSGTFLASGGSVDGSGAGWPIDKYGNQLTNAQIEQRQALARPEQPNTLYAVCQEVLRLDKVNQELVEALEMCINNPWREGTMEYDVLMQVAKAALAKARGTE